MPSAPIPQGTSLWPSGTFLARLPLSTRNFLLTLGSTRNYPPDHCLIQQGDTGNFVYVILHGLVKVTACTENGRETLLAVRVRGDVIGDLSALDGSPHSATVTTCRQVVARPIRGELFIDYLRRHPFAALAHSALNGDRLRWANQRRLEFAGYDSDVCMARLLLAVIDRHGRPDPEGTYLGIPLTQVELGSLIGAKESTVQKILRDLSARGLIRRSHRRVVVVDPLGLASYADLPGN
ncbi:Crp/Fnr family transcriptional regulator [Sinosporangium siamense]|uniref:Crp/Fnr family transcriptional regulator n=1 Tax=Sinosporangium siamense TaxID=1367973 RepID=A0A919VA45_9ACTN|nr:Crp/Fnr family transcriptional regulator [Sinosporangium siamense]GII95012.1 Crp/Fnr family transcriptional regulator [Sinosporangium siamense]